MFMPLYIIVMPYLRHFGSFVPKNRNAINRSSPLGEIRRFVNFVVTRYLKKAKSVDYQHLPLGRFFCYFFLRAEDCAEGCAEG